LEATASSPLPLLPTGANDDVDKDACVVVVGVVGLERGNGDDGGDGGGGEGTTEGVQGGGTSTSVSRNDAIFCSTHNKNDTANGLKA